MNHRACLYPSRTKCVLAASNQFKFQDPWNLIIMTKALKEAQKARMGESKFLNEIKTFNHCSLKHVERMEKTRTSLRTIEIEKAINTRRLVKIFEMRNKQWIEFRPVANDGAVTRTPQANDEEKS